MNLDGKLLVPATSAFDSNGEIDSTSFQSNIRAWMDLGMDGVLVGGSSGESALLESDDRRKLIALAREIIPQDRWLLAGVGSESTRTTISRAKDAANEGANAVLVVSPHYFLKRMTDHALLAHFNAVADASPLPVLLYNIPVYAHVVLSADLVNELSEHENIIGMKDSAGNLQMLQRYLDAQTESFKVLTGSGATFVKAIEMGSAGAILAIALFAGLPVRAAFDAARAGKALEAASLQTTVAPLALDIGGAMGPAGIKKAMDMVGLKGGPTRKPLLAVNAGEEATIRARLESAGLLPT
jgi:4-hydroxy-2-oxoglutarate aldolase